MFLFPTVVTNHLLHGRSSHPKLPCHSRNITSASCIGDSNERHGFPSELGCWNEVGTFIIFPPMTRAAECLQIVHSIVALLTRFHGAVPVDVVNHESFALKATSVGTISHPTLDAFPAITV